MNQWKLNRNLKKNLEYMLNIRVLLYSVFLFKLRKTFFVKHPAQTRQNHQFDISGKHLDQV